MLPPTIPLFPLPNVVLFPNVHLPLHIFEPRYREMVSDALDGDRIIGMVLLRPGWEGDYEGRPSIYPVGCAGLISHAERLSDGRYNIVLRGLEKFRVRREDTERSYRVAEVDAILEQTSEGTAARSAPSAAGSKRSWCRSPKAAASTRRCPRRCPTRIWSTRSRNTWSSRWSRNRRCSNAMACSRAADR